MADTEKDLLAINPDVPELVWAPKQNVEENVPDVSEASEVINETSDGAVEELNLLAVNDKEPALNWTSYNPEVLNEYTPPEEDSWYDYLAAPFRGIQDQLSNAAEATINPVDQLWDALSGGDVDVASIRTSGDRYNGSFLQIEHQIGEAAAQLGTAGAAAFVTAPAGGTGAIPVVASNIAGQALEKYKASYIDALEAGLSLEAAKKEAVMKTWDSLPASLIENLIPFGMGKIPGLNKLISKGAVKLLPNGAVKIIDKPLVKAFLSGGATEGLQEAIEETADIGVEKYVGERAPISVWEGVKRVGYSGGVGSVVGGLSGVAGHALGMARRERTIRRTKEGYEKFVEATKKEASEKDILDNTSAQEKQNVVSSGEWLGTNYNNPDTSEKKGTITKISAGPYGKDSNTLVSLEEVSKNPDKTYQITYEQTEKDGSVSIKSEPLTGKEIINNWSPIKTEQTETQNIQQERPIQQTDAVSKSGITILNNVTGEKVTISDIDINDADTTYSVFRDGERLAGNPRGATVYKIVDNYNKLNQQQQNTKDSSTETTQETYEPVNEEEHIKYLTELENTQRDWFNTNEVKDSKGNIVSYDDIKDNEVYTFINEKGKQQNLVGAEILNLATGKDKALHQPKGMKIINDDTGKQVKLSSVSLNSPYRYTVSIDGEKIDSGVSGLSVHHFAGLYKKMQITTRKNNNGSTTTVITTPSNNKLPGTNSNLSQEITNGSTQTVITENPAPLGGTKKGTVQRAEAVQKQKRNTRKKAIQQSNKKDGIEMSKEVEDNQSEVPGSGNQSTFGQTTETNNTQQTRMGKPDTIETSPEEAIRVMQVDLAETEENLAKQEAEAGVKDGGSLEELLKAGKKIPPTLYKNKIRHLVNKLAGIMDTVIYDKLSQKGIGGQKTGKNVSGATMPKLGYARVRDSMDYVSALHELAHNVWQTGSDLDSVDTESDIHPTVVGVKEIARKRGLSLDSLNDELQAVFPVLNSKVALKEYDSTKVPEEIFCDVYAKYISNEDMANKIKDVAPTVASLIDAHLDAMPGSREIVNQFRTLVREFNKLPSRQRVLSNLQTDSGEQTKLQKVKAWFGQDWLISRVWNRWIDNTHFLRRSINTLYKNHPDLPDSIRYLPDAIEYVLATESYDARQFLDGNGTTADGTDLGRQFKSVLLMKDNLMEVAKTLVDNKKDIKELTSKVKELNDNFLAYLYAMDTLGSYTGNAKVMENFRNLVSDTKLSIKETHALMQVISNKFWNQFKDTSPITTKDLTKEQLSWLKSNNIDINNTVDQINYIKKNIKMPSDNVLINIARTDKAYKHTLNSDDTVDLAKARATWMYKNYHLPAFDTVAETGITLSDAIDVVMETEEDPLADTYKQWASDYYTYQESLLNFVHDYSKGGGAWVNSVRENGHAYYVPLLRMFENNEEQTDYPEVNSRLYKMFHRLGSQRPVRNIWDSTIKQTNALVYGAHQAKIKEAFVDLAETVGGGKYVSEITEKKAKAAVETRDLLMQIKSELETRKKELINQGMDEKELPTGAVEDLYNALYKANLARLNIFAPETNYKKLEEARQFTIWDSENNTLRYFEVDRSIWTAFKKEIIDPNSALGKINKFLGFFMYCVRKGFIEWNPAFNFIINPIRDSITSTLKGDVKLIYLPNHPNIEAFIPFNRSLGSVMSLLTDYYQFIFRPDIMQAKYDLLDQLGMGFNMRRSTYTDLTNKANAGKIIPMNPIRRMFTFRMWLGEEAQTTDKWGRIRELEAYMKRNKITPERAEISASRAASLTLTKGTLVGLGLDNSTLKNILTSEQLEAFDKAKNKNYVYIDLTKDQQVKLDNLVRDNKTISENIKNQQLDVHTRVQLSRAVALATTDFARGGLLTRSLNQVYLFSQASTNGLVQYGEVLRRKWYGGQKADVLGALLEKFLLGYLASAFGFNDDKQSYKDSMFGIRRKIGEDLYWTQPIQFPDQIVELLGTHVYKYLHDENPESVTELIKQAVYAANPYQSFGGLLGMALNARQSVVDIPGVSIWDVAKKQKSAPEQIITESTGWLAIQLSKWTGVPAAKVQYLMNNAGLRFWDKLIESSIGFDSGTFTTTGEWISTSGGFIKNIMQNVLGIDKEVYKTSYELGVDKLSEEADKKVIEASKSGDISNDLIDTAINASNAKKILDMYNNIHRIARDPELKTDIRKKKAEAAKRLYDALKEENIIPTDVLSSYLKEETAKYNNLKKYYKELDKYNATIPNRPSGELESIQKNLGQGVENVLSLFNSEANALPLEGMARYYGEEIFKDTPIGKNILKEQAFRDYQPAEGIIQDEIKNQVPEYTNSKGVKYRPNELQKDVRDNIQATLYDNIDNGIEETIYQISKAIENAPFPSSSSIRTLTAKEVMNNDIFKEKLKLAYKRPINMIDVEEAIADTLISKTITNPATAKFESGGKMWRVKPASKTDKNGHQIGGFGMYQLDPFAKGGDAKMREYINSSRFSSKLSEAYEGNKINYKKLSSIWQEISKNPLVAEAFAKDYEQFMMKEYLPQSLLNEYSRAGYDVGNQNVRDAIFSYSIQRPASARAFAESLPTAVGNSVSPETAIHNIMESKRKHPVLKKYSSRYNDEEEFLLEKERRENESRKRFSLF